jgi:hypothetical protein
MAQKSNQPSVTGNQSERQNQAAPTASGATTPASARLDPALVIVSTSAVVIAINLLCLLLFEVPG